MVDVRRRDIVFETRNYLVPRHSFAPFLSSSRLLPLTSPASFSPLGSCKVWASEEVARWVAESRRYSLSLSLSQHSLPALSPNSLSQLSLSLSFPLSFPLSLSSPPATSRFLFLSLPSSPPLSPLPLPVSPPLLSCSPCASPPPPIPSLHPLSSPCSRSNPRPLDGGPGTRPRLLFSSGPSCSERTLDLTPAVPWTQCAGLRWTSVALRLIPRLCQEDRCSWLQTLAMCCSYTYMSGAIASHIMHESKKP